MTYSLIRPLLFRLDPETAHQLTLTALRVSGKFFPSRWILQAIYFAPSKPVRVFGLDFQNPVGLAAGYDKDGLAINGLAALGFGHIEIGTVTPLPQPGNARPRIFRLVEDEAVINRMGFPGRGAGFVQYRLRLPAGRDWMKKLLETPGKQKPLKPAPRKYGDLILGVNLGRNKSTPNEQAALDYLALLQNFAPYADYLTINVSSPNTEGLRRLQGRRELEALLIQLDQQRQLEQGALNRRLPLLVKLAPDLSDSELDDALDAILAAHMDGVIATNTTLERAGLQSSLQAETGGLSGRPLGVRSEAMLGKVVRRLDGKIPVVSAGGIMGPDDAKRRLDMGAVLVQLYTGLVYRGPGLVKEIVRSL